MVAIEHVGSTAVPGLAAKPIIDIMVGVARLKVATQCIEPLGRIGYEYVPDPEAALPERRFFRRGARGAGTHHLQIVEPGSEIWERQLLFRDFLRRHRETAREYQELKEQLAAAHGHNRGAYTEAKTPFIESVISRARASSGEESFA